jgi:hypothetical protein
VLFEHPAFRREGRQFFVLDDGTTRIARSSVNSIYVSREVLDGQ